MSSVSYYVAQTHKQLIRYDDLCRTEGVTGTMYCAIEHTDTRENDEELNLDLMKNG